MHFMKGGIQTADTYEAAGAYDVTAVHYSFDGDENTGMARVSADTLGFVTGGTLGPQINSSQQFITPAGSQSAPALCVNETDLGFYHVGSNNIGLAANNTFLWDANTARVFSRVPHVHANGSETLPGVWFLSGGASTGMYCPGANAAALTSAGDEKFRWDGTGIGFFGATPVAQPDITGSRGGNAALADLLTELASLGLITDSTT